MTRRYVQRSSSLRAALVRLGAAALCFGVFCGVGRLVSSNCRDSDQGRFVGFLNNSVNSVVEYDGDFLSGVEGGRADFVTLGGSPVLAASDVETSDPKVVGVKHSGESSPLGLSAATKDDAPLVGAEFEEESVAKNDPKADWQDELALTPYETPTFAPLQAKAWGENASLDDDANSDDVALLFAPSTLVRPDGSLVYEPATARDSTRFFAETKAEQSAPVQRDDVSQVGAIVPSKTFSSQFVDSPVYFENVSRSGVGVRRGATPGTGSVSVSIN
ncbi:MAG: hypothetical protein J6X44_10120 [Thermoguttaceae bacterium]|nr:hypothetical protein [Thermoguttaceae bacterium]